MITLEHDNLDVIIEHQGKVVVIYGTDWCPTCKDLLPWFHTLEHDYDITLVYVDADKHPVSRSMVKLEYIPTLALFENGKFIMQNFGDSKEKYKDLISNI
jgi:thioredoxin-like negative regulator of GroEL